MFIGDAIKRISCEDKNLVLGRFEIFLYISSKKKE